MRHALAAYSDNRVQGLQEASPIKLISAMLDESMACIEAAAVACERGLIPIKGERISKAMAIINDGLAASLNKEAGGDIAANLEQLYDYCGRELFRCNVENDAPGMRACGQILSTIRDAWRGVEQQASASASS